MAIPKILHQIWLGASPIPSELAAFRHKWQMLHPDWEHHLWSDDNLPPLRNQREFEQATSWAGKSDILRYELVLEWGGVYADLDVEPFRPLDPLIAEVECFLGEAKGTRCQAIFGAEPGDPFWSEVVSGLPAHLARHPNAGAATQTGPFYIWPLLANHPHVTVFPAPLLYPYGPREKLRRPEITAQSCPDSYCAHHWTGSWVAKTR
jgi:mannosyltransferase OCH1-like enzyme